MGAERILQILAYLFYILSVFVMFGTAFMGFVIWLPLLIIAFAFNAAYNKFKDGGSGAGYSGSGVSTPSRRTCPNCSENSLTRDDFCTSCRKFASEYSSNENTEVIAQPEPVKSSDGDKVCPNCRNINSMDDSFCIKCGRYLDE